MDLHGRDSSSASRSNALAHGLGRTVHAYENTGVRNLSLQTSPVPGSRLAFLSLAFAWFALSAQAAPNGASHLQRSVQLMQQGDLQAAEAEAKLALADPASKPVAYALLGSIRLQEKQPEEGARLLEQAIDANPNLVGARLNLAQAYATLGQSDRAEALYRTVLELAPDNETARFALARLEVAKGRHRQALDLVKPFEARLRASPDGLPLLATAFAGVGEQAAARSLVADWRARRDMPQAWTLKFALALARGGLNGAAIQVLEQVKEDRQASFEIAFNLAGFYLRERELPKAAENYELALSFNDQSVPALRMAARLAEELGELEKALSFLIRAKLEAPQDPDVLYAFGTVCLRLDLMEDGAKALEQARALRPADKLTRYWLGIARSAGGDYDAALSLYQALLEEEPENAQLHYAVGSVHYLKVAFGDAARHFQESLRLNPDQLMSLYYLAMITQKQGRNAEAVLSFQAILEDHPDHAPSLEGLALSLFREKRYEEARRQFERALELNPGSASATYQLGQLLARMGRRAEAKQRLEVARNLREEEERQLVRTLLNPH